MHNTTSFNTTSTQQQNIIFNEKEASYLNDKESVLNLIEKLKLVVSSYAKPSYVYQGEVEFKELYAHSRSNVMFDALNDSLPKTLDPVGVMLIDVYGQPIHFVHKITLENDVYFLDAYGLFTDLDQISSRYGRFVVKGFRFFDATSSSALKVSDYKATKTLTNFIDEGNASSSYTDLFNINLVQTLLVNILSCNKVVV